MNFRKLMLALTLVAGMGMSVGCDNDDGPVENAADNIQDGANDLGTEVENATN